MRLSSPQRRQPPENTIPLINIVFLMLIFFLFAGTISRDDAGKIAPPVSILDDETIRSTGALVIDLEGRTYFESAEISVEDWVTALVEPSTGPLKIAADGALKADHLESVLNQLKTNGRTDVILITRRGHK